MSEPAKEPSIVSPDEVHTPAQEAQAKEGQPIPVRDDVGAAIKAAVAATDSGDYGGAMRLMQQAERTADLTDKERSAIAQMKDYIAVKSGGAFGVFSAVTAQTKFAADYNAGHYRDAINDEPLLIKYSALTADDITIIVQSYYLLNDDEGCARYVVAHNVPSDNLTELQIRCVWEANDEGFVRQAVVHSLAAAVNLARIGCHDAAVLHLGAALAVGNLNADEQSIANRIRDYVASKSTIPDGGALCRDPRIENDEPPRMGAAESANSGRT